MANRPGRGRRERIFIVGSSGNVGCATLSALVTKYGDNDIEIVAGMRDPESDKAQTLAHAGRVQITKADSKCWQAWLLTDEERLHCWARLGLSIVERVRQRRFGLSTDATCVTVAPLCPGQ
jgi:hypothetical protein